MTNNNNQQNQNQQQNQNNAPARPNPFSGGSRFGSGSSQPASSSSPFGRPGGASAPSGSPFGGLRRTNDNQIQWTMLPLQKTVVRLQLSGLGDPLHRLLGLPLNTEFGSPAKVAQALQSDDEIKERLTMLLNNAWESYNFKGAVLFYPYQDEVKKAYTQPWQPVTPPPSKEDGDDDDDSDSEPTTPIAVKYEYLRAIDLALVMNLLARQRAQLVVAGTPLALEAGFLDQVLLTDDPRIVALVQATGSIEEVWSNG